MLSGRPIEPVIMARTRCLATYPAGSTAPSRLRPALFSSDRQRHVPAHADARHYLGKAATCACQPATTKTRQHLHGTARNRFAEELPMRHAPHIEDRATGNRFAHEGSTRFAGHATAP